MSSTARFVILFCIIVSSALYFYIVPSECTTNQRWTCLEWQAGEINHTGEAPYRYRPLAPALVQALSPGTSETALITGGLIFHVLAFTLLYPGLYLWFRQWTNEDRALIGLLVFVALLPVILRRYYLFSYSMLELVLVVWFLIALTKQARFGVLAVLMVVASLNRETGILLAFAYLAFHPRAFKQFGVLVAIWAAITATMHLAFGYAPPELTAAQTLQLNLNSIPEIVISNALFLPLWIGAAMAFRCAPDVFKRLILVSIGYVIVALVGSQWQEVRLLMPVIPLVLPLMFQESAVHAPQRVHA